MTETVTKRLRLHIGGLTPNITPTHLKDRFKIFGQVDDVEQLQPDALGQPRPFAYLTMQITPAQLKRCMNILSGSMYRGTQLRIAEARPRHTEKLKSELSPPAVKVEKQQINKRKRARREMGPEVGKEAQDMGLVNEENHVRSKFWKVTPDHHLIRPLALRPTHTLPPPVIANATVAKASSATDKPVKRNPPNRQRRRVINPLLWAPTHLTGSDLADGSADSQEVDGEWVFEEAEADGSEEEEEAGKEGEEDKVVLGRWRKVKGDEGEAELQVVRVKRRRVQGSEIGLEDEEGSDEEYDWGAVNGDREDSPLFGSRDVGGTEGESPMFASRQGDMDDEAISDVSELEADSDRSPSPLFAPRASGVAIAETVDDIDEEDASGISSAEIHSDLAAGVSPAPSSPLFAARPTPSASILVTTSTLVPPPSPPTAATPLPSAFAPPSIPTALLSQAKSETSLSLSVISSLLASTPNAQYIPTRPGRDEWKGFSESDSEDEDIFEGRNVVSDGVLRLRGGALVGEDEDEDMEDGDVDNSDVESNSTSEPSSSGGSISGSSTSSASSSSSSSSASDSDSDSGSDSTSDSDAKITKPTLPNRIATLRGLFGSKSTSTPSASVPTSGGFSLAALAGDIEMTDELDIPLATHPSQPQKPELELLAHFPKQTFDASPDIPLFFAPASASRGESRPGWAKHPITLQKEQAALGEGVVGYGPGAGSSAGVGGETTVGSGSVGFWRKETDESMQERWNRVRGELTTEWKRKGREARKQRKRRGGGGDDE